MLDACRLADEACDNGLFTLDHSPYPAALPAIPDSALGRAIRGVAEEYPPNDLLGISGGGMALVSRYLSVATRDRMPPQQETAAIQPDTGDATDLWSQIWNRAKENAGETLAPVALSSQLHAPQMDCVKSWTVEGDTLHSDLTELLQSARCGDVLSFYHSGETHLSIFVGYEEGAITLYDAGSRLRNLLYVPDASVGFYATSLEELAEWLESTSLFSLARNGFSLYRLKEELIAPEWTAPTAPEAQTATDDNPIIGLWTYAPEQ